jgi:hypothetical protein
MSARLHIGSGKEHEVYEGECYGIEIGLHLAAKETTANIIELAVDNQAAIKALADPKPGPGRHLSDRVLKAHAHVRKRHPEARIVIRWIPGHEGVAGNEKADVEAKRAAKGPQENFGISKRSIPPMWIGKNACKRAFKEACEEERSRTLEAAPTEERLYELTRAKTRKTHHKIIKQLPRQNRAILTQLRTEHIPLNAYLKRFKKRESAKCGECGEEDETVDHYLLHCKAYRVQRRKMTKRIGSGNLTKRNILATNRGWEALFAYVNDTGRFKEYPKMARIKIGEGGKVRTDS